MAAKHLTRIDLHIPRKQKAYFEQALKISGFSSLTDFIITAVSEKAEAIIEKHNSWLSDENDRKTFFNALLNPPAPNHKLKQAMKSHSEFN